MNALLNKLWLHRTRTTAVPHVRIRVTRQTRAQQAVVVAVVALLVLQLALGLAAERFLRLRDPVYADKESLLARAEAARPGGPRVVMIGTSRAAFGFQATRIEAQLNAEFPGVIAFNFGIPASGPVTHLTYFRRLIEHGHRPDLLLVELLPPMLGDHLETNFLKGDRLRYHETTTAAEYGFSRADVRGRWWSSVLVPWSTLRFPILGRLSPSMLPWHLRYDWSRAADPRGWGTPPVDTVTPEQYAAGFHRATQEYRDSLADLQMGHGARALAELLRVCRDQGIPVLLVRMPEAADFQGLYSAATQQRLDTYLRGLQAECIDARAWVPQTEFTDGHHLLRGGAAIFSERLTREAIAPRLRGAP